MSAHHRPVRGTLSLVLSALALLVALSGTAYAALADGSVRTRHLAANAVTSGKIANGAVTNVDLRDGSVTGPKVQDRSLGLSDLGGALTNQVTTLNSAIAIAAGTCRTLPLTTFNPTPPGFLGSMVVGTLTSAAGGPVVDNQGSLLPGILTATTQNGVVIHMTVCAGASAQNIPVGSVVTWSLIRP